MNDEEQQFLNSLDKQLWDAADHLRSAVNPSEYMEAEIRKNLAGLGYVV